MISKIALTIFRLIDTLPASCGWAVHGHSD